MLDLDRAEPATHVVRLPVSPDVVDLCVIEQLDVVRADDLQLGHEVEVACALTLSREGRSADAKSIMAVMMLAATRGHTVVLSAEGPDEAAALEAVTQLFADRFGEDE